jgi:flagellar M-ring protein FliF
VVAIRNLVAGAVPGLSPGRVTVVDDTGKTLANGADEGDGLVGPAAESLRAEEEAKLRRKVQDIVEGVVGAGRARVNVTAELDLNRVTTEQRTYDPDGQVVRSTQTVEENAEEKDPDASGATTARANIPEGQEAASIPLATSKTEGSQETINYEISSTTRTEVQEPGKLKRVSVAVAVDGVTNGANYQARPPEEMQRIEQLVRSAVGFDAERGDQVSVVNVRFTRETGVDGGTEAANPLMGFDKNDVMRGVELLILALVAALMIFFVARPLLKGARSGDPAPMALARPSGPALPAPSATMAYEDGQLALPGPDVDATIDIAKIEGRCAPPR